MSKKLTTQEFIEKGKKKHESVDSYTKTIYTAAADKVTITCKKHGDYNIIARNYLQGQRCRECGIERRTKNNILNQEEFFETCAEKHNHYFDYTDSVYTKAKDKITIGCPMHGKFDIVAFNHKNGAGCYECFKSQMISDMKLGLDQFIFDANLTHNWYYDYTKVVLDRLSDIIIIGCPVHGDFKQKAMDHRIGKGCKKCSMKRAGFNNRQTDEHMKSLFIQAHGYEYNYSKTKYVKATDKVIITCKKHGDFKQLPYTHADGSGCPTCGRIKSDENRKISHHQVEERVRKAHGELYTFTSEYQDMKTYLELNCKQHGDFRIEPQRCFKGYGCPSCSGSISKEEKDVYDFVSQHIDCEENNRTIIKPLEIDIVIPEKKVAIEYDGIYYHSDAFVDSKYHLNKTKSAINKGYKLIHLFSDEWVKKQEIVKSRILSLIGKTPNKVYARKCEIKEIPTKEASKFLDENHLQGKVSSQVKVGLYYEEELVSLMAFGKNRKALGGIHREGDYELIRFCNKINYSVVGGADKLFKWFLKNYSPNKIITSADRRWSEGELYYKLGFDLDKETQPNYFYVKGGNREGRFAYRKSELVKEGFDKNKTEKEIMVERGYRRIYDCGTLKFTFTPKD